MIRRTNNTVFLWLTVMAVCFLTSCKPFIFEQPMPIDAEVVQEFPSFIEGDFLKLATTIGRRQLIGDFYRVRIDSKKRLKIEKESVIYFYSDDMINPDYGQVDSSVIDGDSIRYYAADVCKTIGIFDSMKSYSKRPYAEISLKNGYYLDNFYKGTNKREAKKHRQKHQKACILKKDAEGIYYLNTQEFEEYWEVMQVSNLTKGIQCKAIGCLSELDALELGKYNLEPMQLETKNDRMHYLAKDADDQKFKELMEFPTNVDGNIWYRINGK